MPDNIQTNNIQEQQPLDWQKLLDQTKGISIHKMGNQEIHRNITFLEKERNRQLMEQEDYEERIPRAYVARFDRR